MQRMTGQKRLNSFIQLPSVLLGTITMWGPLMPLYSCRYATRLIVCSVLPRPCALRGGGGGFCHNSSNELWHDAGEQGQAIALD
jgi:hypothetical protein